MISYFATDKITQSQFKKYFPLAFFILSIGLYGFLANCLRSAPDFNDETEKLVGAMMIADGMRIYKDMFAHHGPLSYMIAQFFYWISGGINSVEAYRFIPMLFPLFSIGAIIFSPAIKQVNFRLFAASLFALGIASMQTIYGLMLGMYQIYAGHFLLCALSLVIIPLIVGSQIPRICSFLGGLCLALAFFSAYSFVISCSFLMLICIVSAFIKDENKDVLRYVILGIFFAILNVSIYLYFFGDFKGYLAYHFYYNQVYYSKISNYKPLDILYFIPPIIGYFIKPVAPTSWLSYIISSSVSIFAFFLILSLKEKNKPISKILIAYFIILIFGIIFSDPRADDNFRMNTLVIVALGFISLVTCFILEKINNWKDPLAIFVITAISILFISFAIAQFSIKTYLYEASPVKYYKMSGITKESTNAEVKLLQTIVSEHERVQQFPFNLNFYILINRLPASGVFYLFPSINDYFEKPVLGVKIDACSQLEERLPKIIYYDESNIWGYDSSTYLGCFENLLQKKYLSTSIMKFVWIRADIAASRDELLQTVTIPNNFDYSWLDNYSKKRLKRMKIMPNFFKKHESK